MRIFVGVKHAAFAPERAAMLARVLEGLGPDPEDAERNLAAHVTMRGLVADTKLRVAHEDEEDEEPPDRIVGPEDMPRSVVQWLPVHIERDEKRQGSYATWRRMAQAGLDACASHLVLLDDDVIPCDDFRLAITKVCGAFDALDEYPIVCLYTNHVYAPVIRKEHEEHWYTTRDGAVALGLVLSATTATEFLAFVDLILADGGLDTEDRTLNLFAMATGRRIWHTCPAMVEHGAPTGSLCGNDDHGHRTANAPPEAGMAGWGWSVYDENEIPHLGRVYQGNHWRLMTAIRPDAFRAFARPAKDGRPGLPGVVELAYAYDREPTQAHWQEMQAHD